MSTKATNSIPSHEDEACNSKIIFDHAWEHFKLHANQRITLFRYYIAFYLLFMTGGGFLAIRFSFGGPYAELSAMGLSIIFFIITLVFQFLDCRNLQLIEYAKDALKYLESKYFSEKKERIFCNDDQYTNDHKFCNCILSHYRCFRIVYYSAYVIIILFFIMSFISLLCHPFRFCY